MGQIGAETALPSANTVLLRIGIPEELVLVQWYATFLLSVFLLVNLPHLSTLTEDEANGDGRSDCGGNQRALPMSLEV
jgi:hypothetical protein